MSLNLLRRFLILHYIFVLNKYNLLRCDVIWRELLPELRNGVGTLTPNFENVSYL